MKKLQIAIKNKINNMRCVEHNQQAEVKITNDKISIDYCCDSFKKKAEVVITKVTKDLIKSELKNAIKKRN